MKSVNFGPSLKQASDLYALAQQASREFEELVGASAAQVEGVWDRAVDEKGQSAITLRLLDRSGEANSRFAPAELQDPTSRRLRFYQVWGDVLANRSHQHLRNLFSDSDQGGETDAQPAARRQGG